MKCAPGLAALVTASLLAGCGAPDPSAPDAASPADAAFDGMAMLRVRVARVR